jgi:hypothetical protein
MRLGANVYSHKTLKHHRYKRPLLLGKKKEREIEHCAKKRKRKKLRTDREKSKNIYKETALLKFVQALTLFALKKGKQQAGQSLRLPPLVEGLRRTAPGVSTVTFPMSQLT